MRGKFQNYFKTPGSSNFRKSEPQQNGRAMRKPKRSVLERFFGGLCCAEGEGVFNM